MSSRGAMYFLTLHPAQDCKKQVQHSECAQTAAVRFERVTPNFKKAMDDCGLPMTREQQLVWKI
eukprot:1260437-Lingulodinium_polyedra.AAC.1